MLIFFNFFFGGERERERERERDTERETQREIEREMGRRNIRKFYLLSLLILFNHNIFFRHFLSISKSLYASKFLK